MPEDEEGNGGGGLCCCWRNWTTFILVLAPPMHYGCRSHPSFTSILATDGWWLSLLLNFSVLPLLCFACLSMSAWRRPKKGLVILVLPAKVMVTSDLGSFSLAFFHFESFSGSRSSSVTKGCTHRKRSPPPSCCLLSFHYSHGGRRLTTSATLENYYARPRRPSSKRLRPDWNVCLSSKTFNIYKYKRPWIWRKRSSGLFPARKAA